MILTVNIGNTHITVGGYEQDTLRAMSSASIWPEAVCGAASTGHCRMSRTACSVISSGSPGPTLTP